MNLAITGVDVLFAGCESRDSFDYCIYSGNQLAGELPPELNNVASLLQKVIRGAIADSQRGTSWNNQTRTALIYSNSNPQEVADDVFARNLDINGPIIDISEESAPWAEALGKAADLLTQSKVDVVIIAAADIHERPSGRSEIDLHPQATRAATMGFDVNFQGRQTSAGAAAVLLEIEDNSHGKGSDGIYAVIRSFSSAKNPRIQVGLADHSAGVSEADVARTCLDALHMSGAKPGDIGYLEVFASGDDARDRIEIGGLAAAYRIGQSELTCGIGSLGVNLGYCGHVEGLARLIRAALSVAHRFIPATRDWSHPKFPELWQNSQFYVPQDSRTWFTDGPEHFRLAGIDYFEQDGTFIHIILGEGQRRGSLHSDGAGTSLRDAARPDLRRVGFFMFPIVGNDVSEILQKASELKKSLLTDGDMGTLSADYLQSYETQPDSALVVSLLGHDQVELTREIDFALKGLASAVQKGAEWQTPLGSYFTPSPLGANSQVAFVYPGAFNSYIGFGRDLLYLFPELYARLSNLVGDVGAAIQERSLYPRCMQAFTKTEVDEIETRLVQDPIAMLTSGMSMAIVYTLILNEVFQVKNQASFGYSLGENSMMFAAGVMEHGEEGKRKLEESPLFHTRLAGPKNAVREYWGMALIDDDPGDDSLWANYVLMASPENVRELLDGDERVFLTHINTPRQVAIAGEKHSCELLIETLHCNALKAPFDYVLHCAAMQSEYPALMELHSWPVNQVSTVRLYASADCEIYPMDREAIARKMAKGLCSQVDFPRLIDRAFSDGARLFIELGAGSNCTRWIDETLKGQPHCAMSINRRGVDDYASILRVLARLCSQRIEVDLSRLYKTS